MKTKHSIPREVLLVAIGELIVSLLTMAVFLLIGRFDLTVLAGALFGAVVTTLNFLFLAIAGSRAFDEALADRGEGEMTEEEAEAFAQKHKARIQVAVVRSQLIRTIVVLLALVGAFLIPVFHGVAALVPLIMFRPILTVAGLIGKRGDHGQS